MADKDDFDFWEEPKPEEQQANAVAEEEELRRSLSASAPAKQGAPRRLVLLLVLLLVLAGAGAYFYLGGAPAPEVSPPAAPVKQPIALPPPAATEEATVKTEQISPPPASVEATPAVPAKSAAPVKTEAPAAQAVPAPPSPPAEQAAGAPAVKAASPKGGSYSLQAGAFLLKGNLRAAEATVRRLGYEPRVRTVHRTLPMTRLRLGAFFAEEGEAKLAALKAVAPEAFLIRQGEYVLVYAGSYQNLDRARRAADLLYEQGIRVEEETAAAEVPLSLLSFGAFADRSAAEQAAVRARAAGLEAIVRKGP